MSKKPITAAPSGNLPLTLVLATHNRGKIVKLRALVDQLLNAGGPTARLHVIDADKLTSREPVEDEATYEGNALLKARALGREAHRLVLADDTGIEIDILDATPGVETKAMFHALGSWQAVHVELDRRMRARGATSTSGRTARLVCVLALVDAEGNEYVARGDCVGQLRVPEASDIQDAGDRPENATYGLADIFVPSTGWASPQLPMPHRAAAFEQLVPLLRGLIATNLE